MSQNIAALRTAYIELLRDTIINAIYDDPAMRAEIRRVGFANGCRAVASSRREVAINFNPQMVPVTVAALRRLEVTRTMSNDSLLTRFGAS